MRGATLGMQCLAFVHGEAGLELDDAHVVALGRLPLLQALVREADADAAAAAAALAAAAREEETEEAKEMSAMIRHARVVGGRLGHARRPLPHAGRSCEGHLVRPVDGERDVLDVAERRGEDQALRPRGAPVDAAQLVG